LLWLLGTAVTYDGIQNALNAVKFPLRAPKSSHGSLKDALWIGWGFQEWTDYNGIVGHVLAIR